MTDELTLLHTKVDHLTDQVALLVEGAKHQQRRNQEMDELKADLIPIGNQLVHLTIQELEEIGNDFELEDLLFLLKRVLRNTNLILSLMDRVEAVLGIADEVDLLGQQVFSAAVETLDRLERSGLFRQSADLFQTLMDGRTLEDLNRMLEAFQDPDAFTDPSPSLVGLLRQLNQPQSRRGLKRLVNAVNVLGASPEGPLETHPTKRRSL